MAKKRKSVKKQSKFWSYLLKVIVFIIKIPYYIVKGIIFLINKVKKKNIENNVKNKRESLKSKYKEFKIEKNISGDFSKFSERLYNSESQIGIILGARGTGKTAIGMKMLENAQAKYKRQCYAIGFKEEEMPSWINVIENIDEIKNNSFVLIDEGGILFSSRNAMSSANKILSKLILISRHKNLTIIFISQNSSNLEVNILRQADFLILKPSSLLQKDFERKIVQKIYDETSNDFKELKNIRGLSYIYSDEFKGFASNELPSFWKTSISKSFK